MTKDETLLVFTLVVSSVSVFLFGILLFMNQSKLVKIMIWASIVVMTFAIAIQTGIRKQKGEFVVTFSCRVKKRLSTRAIEVGIHLSLLSNLFWILKTTLVVGYRLLRFFIISFDGFLGSFRLYLVYFGFYSLLFSGRWLRTSEDRGECQAQISRILLWGMLFSLDEYSPYYALKRTRTSTLFSTRF
ncbi:hypothetical protein BS78_K083100 [Paspalum vaginatum]|uniref:Uncharacterized protein n=1 Tax=Paspalum vaginatum TaxID=158149 RepID=A0A9W7XBU8_9POAL|nr:hypothetical protein BS78_K158600 [Paspalum vaginatum]KAJ1256101.1 hypothetical protein BS78_K083100 [Paspalum vaginatum]